MKIRKPDPEKINKVYALLKQSFPSGTYERRLVEQLHQQERVLHEWVCIHVNKVIAYIAFSNAYNGDAVCGLHLAPFAVKPEYQNRGVGSELVRFALRQKSIQEKTLYVLGEGGFYQQFGFVPCSVSICPFDKGNLHFFSIRNTLEQSFTVSYEPEFY